MEYNFELMQDLLGGTQQSDIEFQGKQYLLIGDRENGGAIATQEQFENFEESFAHLFADGTIRRYNKQIGTRDDICTNPKPSRPP